MKRINTIIIFTMCFAAAVYSQTVEQPIAFYPFNGNVNDESGHGHNGTIHGSPALSLDRFFNENSAFYFDGFDDYITIPHSDELNFDPAIKSYSVSLWVRCGIQNFPNGGIVIKKGRSNVNTPMNIWAIVTYLSSNVSINDAGWQISYGEGAYDNEWKHVVLVVDNSTLSMKGYLDGTFKQSIGFTSSSAANDEPFYIGGTTDYFFKGYIDDIKFFNYALSGYEINELYSESGFSPHQKNIKITSPNGEENWQVGTTYGITWASSNIDSVKIEYSIDNGASWNIIAASTQSNITYNWEVPNEPSTECKIKISDASAPSIYDISDDVFIISKDEEKLLASFTFNGNVDDSSGNGNNGTIHGSPVPSKDRFSNENSAYYFDGIDDYITVPHSDELNFNSLERSYSISLWIKGAAQNGGIIIRKGFDIAVIRPFEIGAYETFLGANIATEVGGKQIYYGSSGNIYDNEWKHIVLIVDKASATMFGYLNGIKTQELGIGQLSSSSNNEPIYIGGATSFFKGYIDDIKLFNYTLSPDEVNNLYNEGEDSTTTGHEERLILYYPFNGNADDESGNSNPGTVIGATLTQDRFGNPNSAYSFDGIDNYIFSSNSISWENLGLNDNMTISVWVKINSLWEYSSEINRSFILSNWEDFDNDVNCWATGVYEHEDFVLPYFEFSIWNNAGGSGSGGNQSGIVFSQWHHVVYTLQNNNQLSIYVDGIKVQGFPANINELTAEAGRLYIGKNGKVSDIYKYFWNGLIDDIRIYNYALNDSEISELYYEGGWTGKEIEASAINIDINPKSGVEGSLMKIFISGKNISDEPKVYFGNKEAEIQSIINNRIFVIVPKFLALPQTIKVVTGNDTIVAPTKFIPLEKNKGMTAEFTPINFITDISKFVLSLVPYDIDSDVDLDLIYCGGDANKSILISENTGYGVYKSANVLFDNFEYNFSSLFLSDVNNDGFEDLIFSGDNIIGYSIFNGTNGFTSPVVITEQIKKAWKLSCADFDNDGDNDIIVSSEEAGNILLFENTGRGGFSNNGIILQSNVKIAVDNSFSSSDVDNDGDYDIIYTSYFNISNDCTLSWIENLGNNSFSSPKNLFATKNEILKHCACDVDGDTDEDIVLVSLNAYKVYILENSGTGVFFTERLLSNNIEGARAVVVTDIDNDALLDIVVGGAINNIGKLVWLKNKKNCEFSSPNIISNKYSFFTDIIAADLHNYGDHDLIPFAILSNNLPTYFKKKWVNKSLSVYYPNGGELLAKRDTVTLVWYHSHVESVNLKYSLDYGLSWSPIITNYASNTSGSGTFDWLINSDASKNCIIRVEDYIDTNVSAESGNIFSILNFGLNAVHPTSGIPGQEVTIFGEGFSTNISDNVVTFGSTKAEVISVSKNKLIVKIPEIEYGNCKLTFSLNNIKRDLSYNFSVLRQYENSNTSFGSERKLYDNSGAGNIISADLDLDGDLDILASLDNIRHLSWFQNDGAGNLGNENIILDNIKNLNALCAADIDEDGDIDLVAAYGNDINKIVWYQNDGAANFSEEKIIRLNVNQPLAINSADLDRDGDLDIVCAVTGDAKVVWYENKGGGVFSGERTLGVALGNSSALASADFDNDGDIDIVSAAMDPGRAMYLFINTGDFSFTSIQIKENLFYGHFCLIPADLNKDDKIDLLVSSNDSNGFLFWYPNLGNNLFGNKTTIESQYGSFAHQVYCADLDNDGNLDVLCANNQYNHISWYKNNGSGSFGNEIIIDNSALDPRSVSCGDFDNDGDLDIVAGSNDDLDVSYYENKTSGKLITLTSPEIQVFLLSGSIHQILWSSININTVNLEYSTGIAAEWSLIAKSVNAADGSYDWEIPNIESNNCRIRIVDAEDPSILAVSSNTFTIFQYPQSISLSNNLTFQNVDSTSSYRMVSLPGNINKNINQTITGNWGADWTAYYDNGINEIFAEYNGTSDFNFTPGKGFWLLSKNNWTLNETSSSVTLSSDNSYSIPLHQGWNIIGNPFVKSLSWSDIKFANNITGNLYYYEGNYFLSDIFEPYKGYYYYNVGNKSILKIPYFYSTNSLSKSSTNNAALKLSLVRNNSIIKTIEIGFNDSSLISYDKLDQFAPPGNFETERLVIYNDSLKTSYKYLYTDYRNSIGDMQSYELHLKNLLGKNLELSIEGIDQLIGGEEVYILDKEFGILTDLKKSGNIKVSGKSLEKKYILFVGLKASISKAVESIIPEKYCLYQNYPNPFNPSTQIRFSIPEQSNIKLEVYNVLGERVALLVNNVVSSGYHEINFDASKLTSGVYFYRLSSNNFNNIKKMVFLK